ncbi:unnamed protein product [Urochloa decumbens]|uniref:HMA domain-containing protein n=1 Tax=Urochloa decumbens TaxID=240449 RepID=A0ABC9EGF2_9POAL
MGKKSGRNGGGEKEGGAGAKATAFLLRIPMHCRCNGCDDKIRAGVKELTLHHGIEALDQTALWTKGELRVSSTADPEKLRRRLHKATGKSVDLVVPKPPAAADKEAAAKKEAAAAAAMEELLRRSLLQQQGQYGSGGGQAAWASQVLPGAGWTSALQQPAGGYYAGGYGAAAQASPYPWAAVQPEPAYLSAYPAATGGAYAYPSAGHGAYGGGYGHYY